LIRPVLLAVTMILKTSFVLIKHLKNEANGRRNWKHRKHVKYAIETEFLHLPWKLIDMVLSYSQLPPCWHLAIADTPLLRTGDEVPGNKNSWK